MVSAAMLRPAGMEARNTPFVDPTALEAVCSEMGRLAVQAGEHIIALRRSDDALFTVNLERVASSFNHGKAEWIAFFYGKAP